jgi:hypothetical protein
MVAHNLLPGIHRCDTGGASSDCLLALTSCSSGWGVALWWAGTSHSLRIRSRKRFQPVSIVGAIIMSLSLWGAAVCWQRCAPTAPESVRWPTYDHRPL